MWLIRRAKIWQRSLRLLARSVALAVVRDDDSDPSRAGVEIDVETTSQGLMFFAAGIIGQNTNLKTPRDFRLEAERLVKRLRLGWSSTEWQLRPAANACSTLLAGMAPEAASNSRS